MKIEDFERIIWTLANQGYVRYWLHRFPEKMAIQILDCFNRPTRVLGMENEGFEWNDEFEIYIIERSE